MLVEIQNLKKYFKVKTGLFQKAEWIHAVNDVSLSIKSNEIVALVGESGCGKSTLGRVCLGLYEPTSGYVFFLGQNVHTLKKEKLKEFRRKAQIIFQDPYAALNPRRTLYNIVAQPFTVHNVLQKKKIKDAVNKLLTEVGLSPPELFFSRYPHELSGGQRQRVYIARAIALNPVFLVADEPVSSLDMSVRAQILNLLKKLKKDHKLSILFITHELSVVRSIANRVAVMYLGSIVELAEVADLFDKPYHPYTEGLLGATPIPKPRIARSRKLKTLMGEPPSPKNLPKGCYFHPRCPEVMPICKRKAPPLVELKNNHTVACWLHNRRI
jgi:oligopeptide/dipeptide ABC transporter ATP-binding protein